MPVTGSSLVLRWVIVQDGVMRRSEEEAVDVIKSGISRAVVMEAGMADVSMTQGRWTLDGLDESQGHRGLLRRRTMWM